MGDRRDEEGRGPDGTGVAEDMLRSSEPFFAAFMAHLPAAAFLKDASGRVLFANAYLQDLFGFGAWEQKTTADLIAGDQAQRMVEDDRRVLLEGPLTVEEAITDRQGGSRLFSTTKFPLRVEGGPPLVGGISVDITERRQAEERMREVEQHLTSLMQTAQGFFIFRLEVDPEHAYGSRVVMASPSITDVAGITDALDFESWFSCLHPEDRTRVVEASLRAVETGKPYDEVTRWYHRIRGEWIWVRTMSQPVYDARGTIRYFNGLCLDITSQKRAEEALVEERNLFKDLVMSQPAGVYRVRVTAQEAWEEAEWASRLETNIHFDLASDRFCELLGVTREELETSGPPLVLGRIHPDDRSHFFSRTVQSLRTLKPFSWEGRACRGDEVLWVHFSAICRTLGDGEVMWTGFVLDITERKRVEETLRQTEERLRQSEKLEAIGQLAGGVAHDFNNQLGGILGFADLLECSLEDPDLKHYARQIVMAATHAAELTKQLLAFGRKGKYVSSAVDIHGLIRDVVDLLSRSIDKRIGIGQRLDAPSSIVTGDPTQLQNVLLNLGLNARDAMPEGGDLSFSTDVVELAESLSADGLEKGRYLVVGVRDTGIGMDEGTKRRIFEPFFTTKGVGRGTGLGLAAVYGTVKSHGGTVHVWSEPGRGSLFQVYLPVAVEKEPTSAPDVTAQPVPKGSGRILLVDDEEVILALAQEILSPLGYEVEACGDPRAALELYRREWSRFDLVILDLVMPKLSGREVFAAMRQLNPQVQVLLSSGYSGGAEAQEVCDLGARAFLHKPFGRAELARRVAEVLARPR